MPTEKYIEKLQDICFAPVWCFVMYQFVRLWAYFGGWGLTLSCLCVSVYPVLKHLHLCLCLNGVLSVFECLCLSVSLGVCLCVFVVGWCLMSASAVSPSPLLSTALLMCTNGCVCVCMNICRCVCVTICLCVCDYLSLCVCVCVNICLSVFKCLYFELVSDVNFSLTPLVNSSMNVHSCLRPRLHFCDWEWSCMFVSFCVCVFLRLCLSAFVSFCVFDCVCGVLCQHLHPSCQQPS